MAARTQRVAPLLEAPASCRQLAARVIDQALKDAVRPCQRGDSHSARVFLSGSWMLHYWCGVAGFDPSRVVRAAKALMAGSDDACAAAWKDATARRRSLTDAGRLSTRSMAPDRK